MECLSPVEVWHDDIRYVVPCGKCAFCLVTKRSSWMFRIWHEMRTQEYPGWFLTLTYNERMVKRAADGRLSLRFRDVQKFIKKIRKAKFYVKYICVGEYGSETKRPHYHMLIWTDCPVVRLENFWSSKAGTPFGKIHVGRISMASAMYTLKYIIQPKQRASEGVEPTRAQFSRGLGLSYLTSAVYDYHTFDYECPVFTGMADGRLVALPRYYVSKIFTKDQLQMERIRRSFRRAREETLLFRKLRAQGVRNIRQYLKRLRVETARRIVNKSKVNELL